MPDELHILVVDDNDTDREAVRRALRSRHRNARVEEATTCAQARAALARDHFDCAFLNLHLPDGDGLGCLSDVRAAGDTTPIVVLTGHGSEKMAVETMRAGATDYLPKSDLNPRLLDHCLRGAIRYQQAQEQVRQAQEELRLRDRAIAAASNSIVIADPHQPDCPIIYANPAFSATTGYPPEEILGRNCRFLQGPDTDPDHVRQMRDALHEERECLVVVKNYRRDGTAFWNELTLSPVRDTEGHLTHFIGVGTDVTQRRADEETLRLAAVRQQALLRDMFASVTEGKLMLCASDDDLPETLPLAETTIALDAIGGGIRALRRRALSACLAAGLGDERRFDLETAVGEAAMNAVVHAGTGIGQVSHHEQGTVQVRVTDQGTGITVENLPNATLRRGYSSAGTMGHGFKMMLQTADRVYLLTGPDGTTVVLEQDRVPPPPAW